MRKDERSLIKTAQIRITGTGKAEWAQRSCEKQIPVRSVSQSSVIIGHQAMDTQRLYLIFCIFLPIKSYLILCLCFLKLDREGPLGWN